MHLSVLHIINFKSGEFIMKNYLVLTICFLFPYTVFGQSYNLEWERTPHEDKSNIVVYGGIYTKEDGSICAIDTRGRSDLVPNFAQPATKKHENLITHNLPKCGPEEEELIKEDKKYLYLTDKSYVKPVGFVGSTLIGCGMGLSMEILFGQIFNEDTPTTQNLQKLSYSLPTTEYLAIHQTHLPLLLNL